jgi:hypothetical protein
MCYQITQTSYTIKDVGHNKNSFKFKSPIMKLIFFLLSHPLNGFSHACSLTPHLCCLTSSKPCMPDNRLKGFE